MAYEVIDWLAAKRDYLKDPTATLEEVAKKYGSNPSYFRYVASKEGWATKKEQIQQSADAKLTETLPETIANVKLRHARLGRNIQAVAMQALASGLKPANFGEATNAVIKGVTIERQALGLNDKDVQDEIATKFQSFTFIFSMSHDELQRFISATDTGGAIEAESLSTPTPAADGEQSPRGDLGTAPVPSGTDGRPE